MTLKKELFVCLDCETTGLDPKKDRIVELACVTFTLDSIIDEYETLVNPECEISGASLAIHHINSSMLLNKPKIKEILPEVFDRIGEKVIVGHGIDFDIELIMNAAKDFCFEKAKKFRSLDTLRLARLYGDSPNNSLSNLAKHFNVEIDGEAHRAMTDVKMNIGVFKHLVSRYKTLHDVFTVLSKPIKMKYMPLGKYKGRSFSDIPLQYLQWAVKLNFDGDLLFSLQSELKKRKKGGQFSQATNPFLGL